MCNSGNNQGLAHGLNQIRGLWGWRLQKDKVILGRSIFLYNLEYWCSRLHVLCSFLDGLLKPSSLLPLSWDPPPSEEWKLNVSTNESVKTKH